MHDIEEIDPMSLFARFYREQNGEDLNDRQYRTALHALKESEEDL